MALEEMLYKTQTELASKGRDYAASSGSAVRKGDDSASQIAAVSYMID